MRKVGRAVTFDVTFFFFPNGCFKVVSHILGGGSCYSQRTCCGNPGLVGMVVHHAFFDWEGSNHVTLLLLSGRDGPLFWLFCAISVALDSLICVTRAAFSKQRPSSTFFELSRICIAFLVEEWILACSPEMRFMCLYFSCARSCDDHEFFFFFEHFFAHGVCRWSPPNVS